MLQNHAATRIRTELLQRISIDMEDKHVRLLIFVLC